MTTAHHHVPRSTLLALGPRSLYIGPAFGLSAHTCTVSVLACGLDGTFQASAGDALGAGAYTECRSAFIPAQTLHHLVCGHTTMAFLYTDALGLDENRLRRLSAIADQPIATHVGRESELIALLQRLGDAGPQVAELWSQFLDLLDINHAKSGDARIARSIKDLVRDPAATHSLADLAAGANLSESRYLHLFKKTTGVPLRRFRLWVRVGAAVRAIARGSNLTQAALQSGFSSSAHFSFVFREMFGMTPSTLGNPGLRYARDALPSTAADSR